MRSVRVIARLDVKGPNVINTIQLEGLRTCGIPNQLAQEYYQQGADELLIIDQVASLYQRGHLLELTKEFARNIFIPVTVGGGIKSVEDARALLRSGADKIAINTAASESPELINAIADEFGSQCVVVSVQAKRIGPGKWGVYRDGGREPTGKDVIEWAVDAAARGAGEILITSIDRDGTRKGFEIDLLKEVTRETRLPIIASGGFGVVTHAIDLLSQTHCEAIALADFLHMRRGGGIHEVKCALSSAGYIVREA